jgi:nucleoside phosphorylase
VQLVVKNLCVTAALGLELKPVGKRLTGLGPHPALPGARTGSCAGVAVHLVRSGVGVAASTAVAEAIRVLEPDGLVCLGTAGGLVPGLRLGAVLASPTVLAPVPDGRRCESDPRLVRAALEAGASEAVCLTVERALFTPAQKTKAREERKAQLCEMEAWFAGSEATKAGVPFLALKVISDALNDALPDMERFMTADGLDAKRAGAYLALHPDEAARAARFIRNARSGMEKLAEVFEALLVNLAG